MNNLVISIFKGEPRAEEARLHLLSRQRQGAVDLEDTVIVEKTGEGEIRFHHLTRQTTGGAIGGAFVGALLGILLLNPVFVLAGLAGGAVIGGVFGALSHIGIDRELVEKEIQSMDPGDSALCTLAREKPEKIFEEMRKFEDDIVQTRVCTQTADLKQCSIWRSKTSIHAPA